MSASLGRFQLGSVLITNEHEMNDAEFMKERKKEKFICLERRITTFTLRGKNDPIWTRKKLSKLVESPPKDNQLEIMKYVCRVLSEQPSLKYPFEPHYWNSLQILVSALSSLFVYGQFQAVSPFGQ